VACADCRGAANTLTNRTKPAPRKRKRQDISMGEVVLTHFDTYYVNLGELSN